MKIFQVLLWLLLLLFSAHQVDAQSTQTNTPIDTNQTYRIEVNDGSVYVGRIIYRDANKIILQTPAIPRLEILIITVVSMKEVKADNYRKGVYWFENPHTNRYYYSPSAMPLKKGEGYYQNTMLLLNSFNVGITDNISIGGGVELITLFGASNSNGAYDPIIFLTPKVGFKVDQSLHLGGGILYVNVPTGENGRRGSFGVTYGVATIGNTNHNLSGGIGWGFVESRFSSTPSLTLSGMTRVSKGIALMTENWFIPLDQYYGIYSYGIRVLGEKTAFDIALVNNPEIAQVWSLGFPFLSYTVRF